MSRLKMEPPSPAIAAALLRRFEAMSLDACSEVARTGSARSDEQKMSSQRLHYYADLTGERGLLMLGNRHLVEQCMDPPHLRPHA
jgi:hypothetical protein